MNNILTAKNSTGGKKTSLTRILGDFFSKRAFLLPRCQINPSINTILFIAHEELSNIPVNKMLNAATKKISIPKLIYLYPFVRV